MDSEFPFHLQKTTVLMFGGHKKSVFLDSKSTETTYGSELGFVFLFYLFKHIHQQVKTHY